MLNNAIMIERKNPKIDDLSFKKEVNIVFLLSASSAADLQKDKTQTPTFTTQRMTITYFML